MLESYPPRSPGVVAGILLILALLLLDLMLLLAVLARSVSLWSFMGGMVLLATMPVLALISYLTRGLPGARYHIESDALIIEWGGLVERIPLAHIRALVWGRDLGPVRRFRGLRWPGFYIGRGEIVMRDKVYPIRFYATRPPAKQLLLVTDKLTYGVSPWDLENFKVCVEALQATALPARTPTSPTRPFLLDWPIWQDRTAHVLLWLPALANVLLFAYLTIIYDDRLPAPIIVQFDAAGQPLALLGLPLLGFAALLGNGAVGWFFYQWRQEKRLAYLIWTATLAVQIAVWVAVLGLTGF
ncbi:MAG: hypothetical protein Fur0021_36360 [Candidatus Promineifilaceae bacterium]